jgi:hypothetical protein
MWWLMQPMGCPTETVDPVPHPSHSRRHLGRRTGTRVSFDIDSQDDQVDQVELTVVHDGFIPDSVVRQQISRSWPRKLADLKSGLEHR